MDADFMRDLDRLRAVVGFPLAISSGYRCPAYNTRISSTGSDGPHTTGKAVDVPIVGARALELLTTAEALGFTGIGVNQRGPHNKRFIHIDKLTPQEGPRPWVWSY